MRGAPGAGAGEAGGSGIARGGAGADATGLASEAFTKMRVNSPGPDNAGEDEPAAGEGVAPGMGLGSKAGGDAGATAGGAAAAGEDAWDA